MIDGDDKAKDGPISVSPSGSTLMEFRGCGKCRLKVMITFFYGSVTQKIMNGKVNSSNAFISV